MYSEKLGLPMYPYHGNTANLYLATYSVDILFLGVAENFGLIKMALVLSKF